MSANTQFDETYDYVVVGAGASGSVVAMATTDPEAPAPTTT